MLLRAPTPLLLGPVPLAWAATVAGPGARARCSWPPTPGCSAGSSSCVGAGLSAVGARALHGLTRRWLVFVPAGLVLHDLHAMVDAVFFPRASIIRLGPALDAPTDDGGEVLDLTLGAVGLPLQLDLREPRDIAPRRGRAGLDPVRRHPPPLDPDAPGRAAGRGRSTPGRRWMTRGGVTTFGPMADIDEARAEHDRLTREVREARYRYYVLSEPTLADAEFDSPLPSPGGARARAPRRCRRRTRRRSRSAPRSTRPSRRSPTSSRCSRSTTSSARRTCGPGPTGWAAACPRAPWPAGPASSRSMARRSAACTATASCRRGHPRDRGGGGDGHPAAAHPRRRALPAGRRPPADRHRGAGGGVLPRRQVRAHERGAHRAG